MALVSQSPTLGLATLATQGEANRSKVVFVALRVSLKVHIPAGFGFGKRADIQVPTVSE